MDVRTDARGTALQLARYGATGLVVNLAGYLVYLAVTALGLEPKTAVSVLYPVGVLAAYFGHARFSFAYRGRNDHGLMRYLAAHACGWGVNVLMLLVFADLLGFPHQAVQAAAVPVVAGLLFILLRWFVFQSWKQGAGSPC